MKIFLDSSKIEEVEKWDSVIEGVTTNPTILKKDGGCDIKALCERVAPRPVSIEACGNILDDALEYKKIPNAVVKVPLLTPGGKDNLGLIKFLVSEEKVKVNCTALFNLSQVVLATMAGAQYVSIFLGRIDDEGMDYSAIIADCSDFLVEYDTELIVGSIRTVGNALDAIRAGADIVTIPPNILEKMVMHRFSLDTVRMFEEDGRKLRE